MVTHMQLVDLERSRFFGSLEQKFEAGQVVLMQDGDDQAQERCRSIARIT